MLGIASPLSSDVLIVVSCHLYLYAFINCREDFKYALVKASKAFFFFNTMLRLCIDAYDLLNCCG